MGRALALSLSLSAGAGALPKAPPAPELPPVPLRASLEESGPDEPWLLTIENVSSVPIRLFDDPRALTLDVTRPGSDKTHHCRLPDELFPKQPSGSSMRELEPGESAKHHVDPRYYCFSAGVQELLVPTAQVTAVYGFPSKTKKVYRHGKAVEEKLPDTEPFVAEPKGEGGTLGPAKNATGDPVVLDARYAPWSDKDGEKPDDEDKDSPSLVMVKGSDAQAEQNVTATVRIKNPLRHRLVVFLRRELLTFEVHTPHGTVSCDSEPDMRNPDRRAFSSIAPGGSVTLVSRLVELCPRGTFAVPGLYVIDASLDAPANGSDYGLDAFTGSIHSERPVTVRVRRETQIVRNRVLKTNGAPGGPPPPPGAPPPGIVMPPAPAPPPPAEAPPPPPPPPPQ